MKAQSRARSLKRKQFALRLLRSSVRENNLMGGERSDVVYPHFPFLVEFQQVAYGKERDEHHHGEEDKEDCQDGDVDAFRCHTGTHQQGVVSPVREDGNDDDKQVE